ncbi:hypothetical protein FJQ98_12250 [Lysinibacillus agricola]|uniref:Uncharacterized protein n=1 Tax=Lysinibacillus agricola TaxID=2590012 RepID=A0ABX7AXM4_9BACI|nr:MULTISPECIES: hypothetical protein [Lysinibacillus]KOS64436.1 hypothetical protein AN161_02455 [Lysinibacillus sp. FJAT-14222]QQP14701.1 hypothetical protein FJQ98_12250 [Lysinibacillus agricola]
MQVLILTLVVISSFLLQQPQESEENTAPTLCIPFETTSYKYPNNQYQTFRTEDDFYHQLDRTIYEEYNDATLNIRQKIAFKDIPKAEETFHLKTNFIREKIDLSQHTFIHPNRQVYFLASFQQTNQETYHKYLVIDAETQTIILGDSNYQSNSAP